MQRATCLSAKTQAQLVSARADLVAAAQKHSHGREALNTHLKYHKQDRKVSWYSPKYTDEVALKNNWYPFEGRTASVNLRKRCFLDADLETAQVRFSHVHLGCRNSSRPSAKPCIAPTHATLWLLLLARALRWRCRSLLTGCPLLPLHAETRLPCAAALICVASSGVSGRHGAGLVHVCHALGAGPDCKQRPASSETS